jgi:hypothetical protein
MPSRIERERKTVTVMIGLYCRKHHASKTLCPACSELVDYAAKRLMKCPYGEGKTTCTKCPAHCYKPEMRNRIRIMMRYSGPRMLRYHPAAALRHIFDERRQKPETNPG